MNKTVNHLISEFNKRKGGISTGTTVWGKSSTRIFTKKTEVSLYGKWYMHEPDNNTENFLGLSDCCIVTIQQYKYTDAGKYETLTTLRCSDTKRLLTSLVFRQE